MKVIVTGGAGFIGSYVVKYLINKGYDLVIIDDLSTSTINSIKNVLDKVVFVYESILNTDKITSYFKNTDIVIHLAAIPSVEESIKNPIRVYQVNTFGTINLLELARKYDISRFIYISSAAVYGNPIYTPINEEHPCKPISIYGVSKYSSELLVLNYYRNYGLKYTILRLFNVYGPGMKNGVIYHFIKNMLLNRSVTIYGNGEQTRDFIYVEDVSEAIYSAMSRSRDSIYNIGSGQAISIKQLFNEIKSIIGSSVEPIYEKERSGDIQHSVADINRAIDELGWKPRTSLKEGLEKTINYFKQIITREYS